MSSNISDKDKKTLGWQCGNKCAMPKCDKELIIDSTANDRESIIGEFAHIKGERPNSARYDPQMEDKDRNSHQNLIIVCCDHHKIIDDQPNTYTVEKLHQIKKEHADWFRESTIKEVINVTFAELSVVTKYLASGQYKSSESLTVIPPKNKIKRNNLSSLTEKSIIMGMTQVKQVADFINKCPDVEFGERLKQGFVEEYERLKNEQGLLGDDLFESLLDFAAGKSNNFKERAAGLAVLVYLFEKCEVFEQ